MHHWHGRLFNCNTAMNVKVTLVVIAAMTLTCGNATDEIWECAGLLPRAMEIARHGVSIPLPASLADEPEPVVEVFYEGALPKLRINGVVMEPDVNLLGHRPRPDISEPDCNAALKISSLGFHIYQIHGDSVDFEKAPGVYDFSWLDSQARMLLAIDPQAYLILSLRVALPHWCETHPGDVIGYGTGPATDSLGDERVGRRLRPSAASEAYRKELSRLFAQCGTYVHTKPWAKRIIMLRPC